MKYFEKIQKLKEEMAVSIALVIKPRLKELKLKDCNGDKIVGVSISFSLEKEDYGYQVKAIDTKVAYLFNGNEPCDEIQLEELGINDLIFIIEELGIE